MFLKIYTPPGKFDLLNAQPAKESERTSLFKFHFPTLNFFRTFCEHYPTFPLESWAYNVPLMFWTLKKSEHYKAKLNEINDLAQTVLFSNFLVSEHYKTDDENQNIRFGRV